jgi:hypothetical protein
MSGEPQDRLTLLPAEVALRTETGPPDHLGEETADVTAAAVTDTLTALRRVFLIEVAFHSSSGLAEL